MRNVLVTLFILLATPAAADLSRTMLGGGAIALGPTVADGDDKSAHILVGAGISILVTEMTGEPGLGILAGIAAGALKEAIDSGGRGTVSRDDFAATALGAGMPFMTLRW